VLYYRQLYDGSRIDPDILFVVYSDLNARFSLLTSLFIALSKGSYNRTSVVHAPPVALLDRLDSICGYCFTAEILSAPGHIGFD